MKSIKQLREEYDLITEKEEQEQNKLIALVRAGLFDAKKLPMLKRAMEKTSEKMTSQEKSVLINLLGALMSEVLSNKQVYRKIKQDVMMKESKDDKKGMVAKDVTNIPAVIVLKRKALRVFPGGQKVGLYYSQTIDKYVTIPFNEIGIGDVNEEISLEEGLWDKIKGLGKAAANSMSSSANSSSISSSSKKSEPKYYDPMASKLEIKGIGIGSRGDEDSNISPALRSWERQRYRQSLQMQEDFDYEQRMYDVLGKVRPPLGILPGYGRRKGTGSINSSKLSTKKYTGTGDTLNSGIRPSGPKRRIVPKRKDPRDIPQRESPKREIPRRDPRDIPQREAPRRQDPIRRDKPPEKKPEKPEQKPDARQAKGQNAQTRPQNRFGGSRFKRLAGAAAGLGILGSLFSGSSENKKDDEKKYYTPKDSKFKPTIADPKYSETDASVKSLERRLFRKSMMENIELDGNLFEINSNIADKCVNVYKSLNENNKKKMIDMMLNEETQNKIIEFVRRY